MRTLFSKRKKGYQNKSIKEIVKEIVPTLMALPMSAKKDALVKYRRISCRE